MGVSSMRAVVEDQQARHPARSIHLAPSADRHEASQLLDRAQAAQALARFLDEAREILDRLEEAWIRREAGRPGKGIRRDVLRFLAGAATGSTSMTCRPWGPWAEPGAVAWPGDLRRRGWWSYTGIPPTRTSSS
jgi:hypothetical protein